MTEAISPERYLAHILPSLELLDQAHEDRLGLIHQAAAAAAMCGYAFDTRDSLAEGVALTIQLPTGDLSWWRPNGELKVTPGPENATRIRAYLDQMGDKPTSSTYKPGDGQYNGEAESI